MPSTQTHTAKLLSVPVSGKSLMCTKCHSGVDLYVLEAQAFSQLRAG